MGFQSFAKQYAQTGLKVAFGIPGGGPSLELVDALQSEGVDFITTGHESTAAMMAGGLSRVSNQAPLSISIKGPGFANMAPGLLCNRYERNACLSVSEAYPEIHTSGRYHKWMNHQQWSLESSKATVSFEDSEPFFGECQQLATSNTPGPIHINLASCTNSPLPNQPYLGKDELATEIKNAKQPILIAGDALRHTNWQQWLKDIQIPIFTTVSGKGLIPETSNNSADVYTGSGTSNTLEKIYQSKADCIIFLGVQSGELLDPSSPEGKTIFLHTKNSADPLAYPPNDLTKLGQCLSQQGETNLYECLKSKSWGLEDLEKEKQTFIADLLQQGYSPAHLQVKFRNIQKKLIHVLDTGNFTVCGEHALQEHENARVIGTPNGRYMGAGLPYALGAACHSERTPVVLWIGDGGIRSFAHELNLAVQHQLPLLVMHMRDGYFGSIRPRAIKAEFNQKAITVPSSNLEAIYKGYGFEFASKTNEQDVFEVVESWIENPKPTFLDCPFDSAPYTQAAGFLR